MKALPIHPIKWGILIEVSVEWFLMFRRTEAALRFQSILFSKREKIIDVIKINRSIESASFCSILPIEFNTIFRLKLDYVVEGNSKLEAKNWMRMKQYHVKNIIKITHKLRWVFFFSSFFEVEIKDSNQRRTCWIHSNIWVWFNGKFSIRNQKEYTFCWQVM